MNQSARKTEENQNFLETGQVLNEDHGFFSVKTDYGPVLARQAASCLVKPQTGDLVLTWFDAKGSAFILSVLETADSNQETELVFDRQVNLKVRGAGLAITADRDITLAAEGELAGASSSVSIHAENGRAVVDNLSFLGRVFEGRLGRINLIAKAVDHLFNRLTQRLKNTTRYVEENEEIQTGSTRYLVEDSLTMQSKNAMHQAEEIITLNGEQIHMG